MNVSASRKSANLLRALFDRWLENLREHHPRSASQLGFLECRNRLGENTPAFHRKHARFLRELLEETEALPAHAFTGEDRLDRREFLSHLRTELFFLERFPAWKLNPQIPLDAASSAIFEFVIQTRGEIHRDADALIERMEQIPRFLEQGVAGIKNPDPLWVELAHRSAEGAIEFFDALAGQIRETFSPPLCERGVRACASAKRAVEAYISRLDRIPPGPKGTFAVGKEGLEFLIRERLGLDWSVAETLAVGKNLIAQLKEAIAKETRKHGRKKAAAILEEAAERWNPERPLLEEYAAQTLALRRILAEKDLVSIPPGETLRVLPAPPFMRHHFPTAAYSAPGPFAKKQEGVFWVNDLSLHAKSPAQAAAERRQHFGIELTCAHEAYPGHHLQFCVQNRLKSRIRRIANHAIFYEGWTLWCEKLVVEEKLADFPELRLTQLHDALWRAYRIAIDCGIQTGGLSLPAARSLLVKGVNFTPARAQGDLNWYTSSPSIPMSYLLGLLELEETRSRFLQARRGASLRDFHDWVLGHGAIPWTWIRQTL